MRCCLVADQNPAVDVAADLGYQCRHCGRHVPRLQPYIVHLFAHGLNDKEVDLEFSGNVATTPK